MSRIKNYIVFEKGYARLNYFYSYFNKNKFYGKLKNFFIFLSFFFQAVKFEILQQNSLKLSYLE